MNVEYIAKMLAGIVGPENVLTDEPMKRHTSFRVGGPADIMAVPGSIESLEKAYAALKKENVPLFVMGNGTNLIVSDKGIRGVVIRLSDSLGRYMADGEILTAEAGVPIAKLSKIALENSLSGLEFAEGIPGTLGGAVTMNAGAYDGEMSGIVLSTEYINSEGNTVILANEGHMFGKRSSFIQTDGGVVLRTRLKLKKGSAEEIRKRMEDFNRQRHLKQPLHMPSAGSIFKRPEGFYAGKLIQDCGLKGFRVGGAEVSGMHCGFIVNSGNATAYDITTLIGEIQERVLEKFGVELYTEVKIVGEE